MVSKGTHEQLTNLLYEIDHLQNDPNASNKTKLTKMQKLRTIMEKFFSFREIYDLHDDHVIELAEIIVGLYPELSDLDDYTYHILEYLSKRIHKYERTMHEYKEKLLRKEREKDIDPDGYLDLKYLTWTYTHGYHYQTYHTYILMKIALEDLMRFKRDGVICSKKNTKTPS